MKLEVIRVSPVPGELSQCLVLFKVIGERLNKPPEFEPGTRFRCGGSRFTCLEHIPATTATNGNIFGLKLEHGLLVPRPKMILRPASDALTPEELSSTLHKVMHLIRQVIDIDFRTYESAGDLGELGMMLKEMRVGEEFEQMIEAVGELQTMLPPMEKIREMDEANRAVNKYVNNIRVDPGSVPPIG